MPSFTAIMPSFTLGDPQPIGKTYFTKSKHFFHRSPKLNDRIGSQSVAIAKLYPFLIINPYLNPNPSL